MNKEESKMTLREYVWQTKMDLDEFENWWNQNHDKEPNDFPLELGEGDWDEQFNMFVSIIDA